MPDFFEDSFGSLEGSLGAQTPITKDEPLDYDEFSPLGMLIMSGGPITPASTAPSDLILGSPCDDSPTPSYSATSASPTPGPSDGSKADGEKKPVKKRKSWGQVLPTPTTNLPPRYDFLQSFEFPYNHKQTNSCLGNEPRLNLKRNSGELSVSSETAKLRRPRGSARGLSTKLSKRQNLPSRLIMLS